MGSMTMLTPGSCGKWGAICHGTNRGLRKEIRPFNGLIELQRRCFGSESDSNIDIERKPRMLRKSLSINSGVGLERSVSIGTQENIEAEQNKTVKKSLIWGDIHGSYSAQENVDKWRKRPLFQRGGIAKTFATGREAAELLCQEAMRRDPYQRLFLDSLADVCMDIAPLFEREPGLAWFFKKIAEPVHFCTFRVPWIDSQKNQRINRGYRVQYSAVDDELRGYRGGIRFHPTISHATVRMLGWEQLFKNVMCCSKESKLQASFAGSDFDMSSKSQGEILSFSKAFGKALARSSCLGAPSDHLFSNLSARGLVDIVEIAKQNGASHINVDPSALVLDITGTGGVHFARRAMERSFNAQLNGQRCLISGANDLSFSVARSLINFGAAPVTFSDVTGYIHEADGFDIGDINRIEKTIKQGHTLSEYALANNKECIPFGNTKGVWGAVDAELAFPCDAEEEIEANEARMLADRGCMAVFEIADRATSKRAQKVFSERKVLLAPSKAVSCFSTEAALFINDWQGLDSIDNPHLDELVLKNLKSGSMDISISSTPDYHLEKFCDELYDTAANHGHPGNLKVGANIYGFQKLLKA